VKLPLSFGEGLGRGHYTIPVNAPLSFGEGPGVRSWPHGKLPALIEPVSSQRSVEIKAIAGTWMAKMRMPFAP